VGRHIAAPLVALIACFAIWPVSGREQIAYLTGEKLYQLCTSPLPVQQGECVGYLEGIVDAGDNTLIGSTCVRPGVTTGQLRDVVVTYLRKDATPDQLSVLAGDFFVRMALASFCGNGRH
jgi:hypothetical protein